MKSAYADNENAVWGESETNAPPRQDRLGAEFHVADCMRSGGRCESAFDCRISLEEASAIVRTALRQRYLDGARSAIVQASRVRVRTA